MRLAFYTFTIGRGPRGSEAVAGLEALLSAFLRHADATPGFIARAKRPDLKKAAFGQDFGAWGEYCAPRFYDGGLTAETESQATTLSIWVDVNAVRSFAYGGLHRRALDQGDKWFREAEWPTYVMWWIADDEVPTWQQASLRIEHRHDNGATPFAFDFKQAFEPDGTRSVRGS